MNRLTNVTDLFGEVVDYNYDANGNRTKLILNAATVATYRYDAVDRLTKILDQAVKETFAVAIDLGGTISGEHGIGYLKVPYLDMALDAATIETMKRIKQTLDPNNILNPGKMFV